MWQLTPASARAGRPDRGGAIEWECVSQGITVHAPSGAWQHLNGARILQLTCSDAARAGCERIDRAVRGTDLIEVYRGGSRYEYRWQVYWRLIELPAAWGIEAIVGIQTERLDSQPTIGVESEFPQALLHDCLDAQRQNSVHLRWPGTPTSYLEMTPHDPVNGPNVAQVVSESTVRTLVRWRLLQESLEKGVLRVARIAGLFLANEESAARASQMYAEYLGAEPPLTA